MRDLGRYKESFPLCFGFGCRERGEVELVEMPSQVEILYYKVLLCIPRFESHIRNFNSKFIISNQLLTTGGKKVFNQQKQNFKELLKACKFTKVGWQ